jgi:rhodanese-related sulfurtransferase
MQLRKLFTPVASKSADQAKKYMEEQPEGSYTFLDVRQPSEYEASHIPGATLIPLPDLPDSLDKLDPEKPTVVY